MDKSFILRSDFVDIVPETKLDEEGTVASTFESLLNASRILK